MKNFTVRRLVTDAMLTALCYVLSTFAPIKTGSFKFTFEAIPVLIGALLSGPVDGFIIGGLGSFMYQLLSSGYGLTATTLLWVLPHAASGLAVGFCGRRVKGELNFVNTALICFISAVLVTALNTLALYVDSKLFGYYTKAFGISVLAVKILTGAILSVAYASVLPPLLKAVKRIGKR